MKENSAILSAILIGFFAAVSFGTPDSELKSIRDFAAGLNKQKALGAPTAYCEFKISRQTNSCGAIENRYLVHSNGLVEMRIFKSYREGPEPRPGLYQGKFPQEKWRELLEKVSKMHWENSQEILPMPSPEETISELVLSDGKKTVAYSLASQEKSSSIEDGFYMPGIIAQNATDTTWSLTLLRERSSIKNGVLEVKIALKANGKSPVWLAYPSSPENPKCGKTSLRWQAETEEGSLATGYIESETPAKIDTAWSMVKPNSFISRTLRFKLPKTFKKGKMKGKLIQTGILAKTAEKDSPMSVTLYSDSFSF